MRKFVPAALALAFALILLAPGAGAAEPPRTILVSGTGETAVVPDLVTITLGVSAQGASPAEAIARNSADMARVFALLREGGVAERDIHTSQFSLSPVWQSDADNPTVTRIAGYQVYNLVTLRYRRIDALGALLDQLARGGVNQIDGISFDIADPGPAIAAARRAAVADAKARAELYAEAAGVTLGALLSLTEQGAPVRDQGIVMRAEAASLGKGVPVAGGEGLIRAEVSLVYSIK